MSENIFGKMSNNIDSVLQASEQRCRLDTIGDQMKEASSWQRYDVSTDEVT